MVDNVSIKDIEDFNKLGLLVNSKFDKLFDLNTILDSEFDYVFGYYEENLLLGFIHVNKMYEVMDIVNIVVDESQRRKGIASKLLEFVIKTFDDVDKLLLEVNEDNLSAINLYKKFNFKIINVRKNYYGNKSALIMERDV